MTLRNEPRSLLDRAILERILAEYEVDAIYHLAAILSTRAEFTPLTAHQVNVEGTLKLRRAPFSTPALVSGKRPPARKTTIALRPASSPATSTSSRT